MKTMIISLSITVLIVSGLLTSCKPNKKILVSTPASPKARKDSTATTYKAADKNSTAVKKNTGPQAESIVNVPPVDIQNKFVAVYPSATNVTWAKETPLVGVENNKTTNYEAIFLTNGKKNWVTYSVEGNIVEQRQEILADQLPKNVYNAIKKKYPNSSIVSATTYKHIKNEGSYSAIIKPLSGLDMKEVEIILRENGSFVEQ